MASPPLFMDLHMDAHGTGVGLGDQLVGDASHSGLDFWSAAPLSGGARASELQLGDPCAGGCEPQAEAAAPAAHTVDEHTGGFGQQAAHHTQHAFEHESMHAHAHAHVHAGALSSFPPLFSPPPALPAHDSFLPAPATDSAMQWSGLSPGLSQPLVSRGATGESLLGGAGLAPERIGPLAPSPPLQMHMHMHAYSDSLIDAEHSDMLQQQAAARMGDAGAGAADSAPSRKRARASGTSSAAGTSSSHSYTTPQAGNAGIDLTDSTFQMYVPPLSHKPPPTVQVPASPLQSAPRAPSSLSSARSSAGSATPVPLHLLDKEEAKKVKHQMTDRQRRAKIKESMDELRKLVPIAPEQKADQATIVGASVTMLQDLKDEVAQLRQKLQQMEMSAPAENDKLTENDQMDSKHFAVQQGGQSQHAYLSNAPFTAMMASLNGAGVSMWRIGVSGKILEVNLVWELVSGFSAGEVVGRSPCGPPLFGSLSIMPSSFLKAFAHAAQQPATNQAGEALEHSYPRLRSAPAAATPSSVASSSTPRSPQPLELPITPDGGSQSQSQSLVSNSAAEDGLAPGSGSVAPLYANAPISNFPIVPQASLESFFPDHSHFPDHEQCKQLIESHSVPGIPQPQPHGAFLFNHLAALPQGHVLKLLSRHHTLWGEVLESIVTMCLVRDSHGQPDFILTLSTPDCRRLLKPAGYLQSSHMQSTQPSIAAAPGPL